MRTLACLAALALLACASPRGFDRGALARELRPVAPAVTDEDIGKALATRPQLRSPFKLAVYFKPGPPMRRWGDYARPYQWTGTDKEALLSRLSPLVGPGGLSEVIPVSGGVVVGDDLKSIRLGAARYGADAVLVVSGAGQVDRYNNGWAGLYVTIVGAFIVPGTEADGLFVASAVLWDVRNEYLYASAEAEGTEHVSGPPSLVDDDRVLATARTRGAAALGAEVERRLRSLHGAVSTAPQAVDPESGGRK